MKTILFLLWTLAVVVVSRHFETIWPKVKALAARVLGFLSGGDKK
jgi:hypothetical protein